MIDFFSELYYCVFDCNFLHPNFFWILLIIPFLVFQNFFSQSNKSKLFVANFINSKPKSVKNYLFHLLFFLRVFAIIFLVVVLARPQTTDGFKKISKEGIDIILAIDISSSMLAKDFKPNRLRKAKDISIDFIERRTNDRLGLVVYAGESFTQCPLTTDYNVVKSLMKKIKIGMVEDGTAIGLGLGTAINRLINSESKSKVVILLTDGVNNVGNIDPILAADMAKQNSIKIYTIGIGSDGVAPFPQKDMFGRDVLVNMEVEIDEVLLKTISKKTGGKYFRANNAKKLAQIYVDIEKMEKNTVKEDFYSKINEEYLIFAFVAFFMLSLEMLLTYTFFKKIF